MYLPAYVQNFDLEYKNGIGRNAGPLAIFISQAGRNIYGSLRALSQQLYALVISSYHTALTRLEHIRLYMVEFGVSIRVERCAIEQPAGIV